MIRNFLRLGALLAAFLIWLIPPGYTGRSRPAVPGASRHRGGEAGTGELESKDVETAVSDALQVAIKLIDDVAAQLEQVRP